MPVIERNGLLSFPLVNYFATAETLGKARSGYYYKQYILVLYMQLNALNNVHSGRMHARSARECAAEF